MDIYSLNRRPDRDQSSAYTVERSTHIVEELGTSVSVDVVRIEITPSQLNVNPVLVAGSTVKHILAISHQRRSGDVPLWNYERWTTCTGP